MGNSSSSSISSDLRKSVHKKMEQSMRMQLIVPYNAFRLREDIKLFAMGKFEGGEFRPIADLTVNTYLRVNMEVHNEPPLTASYYRSMTHNNVKCGVNIEDSFVVNEVYIDELNNALINKIVDKQLYGFGSDLYVVRKVCKSTNFSIVVGDDVVKHTSDKSDTAKTPKTPKTWGYNLQHYKINSKGRICSTRETGKVY